jgi:hypothetical protein
MRPSSVLYNRRPSPDQTDDWSYEMGVLLSRYSPGAWA